MYRSIRFQFLAIAVLPICLGAQHAIAGLVINEIMANPNGPGAADVDSNCDTTFNFADDEYVELVNDMTTSLDISNWTLNDGAGLKHTFAMGTVLAPGQAFVLFGGGSSTSDCTCGALFDVASSGSLGLNNSGDTVTIFDAMGTMQASESSGTVDGVAVTRNPDITGNLVSHTSTLNELESSVGKMNDGTTAFPVPEPSSLAYLILGALLIGPRKRT